jgi:hypothetical protein
LSADISVLNPHGHSQEYIDWAILWDLEALAMPNVIKNRHYRHEKNARRVLLHADNILRFLSDLRDGRDDLVHPNKVTKLGNADSHIWLALDPNNVAMHQNEVYAQLCAMDMMDCLFYSPALCMITSLAVDVVTVGEHLRAAHYWLARTVLDKSDLELMRGGIEDRCFPGFHKKDKSKAQDRIPFALEFKPPMILAFIEEGKKPYCEKKFQDRVMEYFHVQVNAAAKAVLSIAKEYFVGGHLFEPTSEVVASLSGYLADNDPCEEQLGDHRNMLNKCCGKVSTLKFSGYNMARHNNFFADMRSGKYMSTVALRGQLTKRRLEGDGTEKERRARIRKRIEPIKHANRELMMAKVARRRVAHLSLEGVTQFRKGSEVAAVLQLKAKTDEKLSIIKKQLYIYRDLLHFGQKKVPMGFNETKSAGKVIKYSGDKLWGFLYGLLTKLIGDVRTEYGCFKTWRQVIEAGEAGDAAAYNEDCAESESDGETEFRATAAAPDIPSQMDLDSDGDCNPESESEISEGFDAALCLQFMDAESLASAKPQWRRRSHFRREQALLEFESQHTCLKSLWRAQREVKADAMDKARQEYLQEECDAGSVHLNNL